jgi:hypothetical protein
MTMMMMIIIIIIASIVPIGGTWWHYWLRHCAIGWKVAVAIPDGVTGIFH